MDDRIFYGPFACSDCTKMICKASYTQGGEVFDYPDGPIYPNTEWKRHNCAAKGIPTPRPDIEADKEWARRQPHSAQ